MVLGAQYPAMEGKATRPVLVQKPSPSGGAGTRPYEAARGPDPPTVSVGPHWVAAADITPATNSHMAFCGEKVFLLT